VQFGRTRTTANCNTAVPALIVGAVAAAGVLLLGLLVTPFESPLPAESTGTSVVTR